MICSRKLNNSTHLDGVLAVCLTCETLVVPPQVHDLQCHVACVVCTEVDRPPCTTSHSGFLSDQHILCDLLRSQPVAIGAVMPVKLHYCNCRMPSNLCCSVTAVLPPPLRHMLRRWRAACAAEIYRCGPTGRAFIPVVLCLLQR